MPFARAPRRTLALFFTSTRNFSSTDQLIIKFSQLLKHFTRSPSDSPQIPSRPRHPHPFEYNALMKEFSRRGNFLQVLRLFQEMKLLHCKPDLVCYSTVIDTLATWGRPREALAVFTEMVVLGMAPDLACFTILVKLYSCYLKQFDMAYVVVLWMVKCEVSPDVVTYSTLIAGLCREGRAEEALSVLDLMLGQKCVPNVHTGTPIVQAYCFMGRIEQAKMFIARMEEMQCLPNAATYNVLIRALCRIRAFDEVEKILSDSRMKGWEPDEISYSVYMNGLCKVGMVYEAYEVLELMIEKGLRPNAVTLNIFLDCLCRGSKVQVAMRLLERCFSLDWYVNVVNYNTVMSRLCDYGSWKAVLKLFVDMLKKGIFANERTFTIVINSLCKAGKLRMAKGLFDSEGFNPNVVTYTTMIHHCYVAEQMDEVHRLFSKMEKGKVLPNVVTYSIMVDFLCKERNFLKAMECFHKSLKDGFSPHLVARLMVGLVRGGNIREAVNLIDQIRGLGLIIDVCIFSSFIKSFCGIGFCRRREIYQLCHIIDKMLEIR